MSMRGTRENLSHAEGGMAASAFWDTGSQSDLGWFTDEKTLSTYPAEKMFDVGTVDANYAKTSELV